MTNYFRCSICNRFMSYEDVDKSVVTIGWGTCYDLQPNEEEYTHHKCWDNLSEEDKALWRRASWYFHDKSKDIGG